MRNYQVKFTVLSFSLMYTVFIFGQDNVPVIAVGNIETTYRNINNESIKTSIESSLAKTRKFRVMERANLNQLLEERSLSIAGIADGVASLSGFSGVDYLIMGRVMEVGVINSRGGVGGSLLDGLVSIVSKYRCLAVVSLNVRVNDVHTGEIRISDDYTAAKRININWPDYNPDYRNPCRYVSSNVKNQMLQFAANDVGEAIARKITLDLFPIKIIQVQGSDVYLNYGDAFLSKGDYLNVASLGEGFVDPDTGEVLGVVEENIGYIHVTDVREKYSVGKAIETRRELSSGDIAQALTEDDVKSLKKRVAAQKKATAKLEKQCDDAKRRAERRCSRDEQSSRCLKAKSDAEKACG